MNKSEKYDRLALVIMGMLVGEILGVVAWSTIGPASHFIILLGLVVMWGFCLFYPLWPETKRQLDLIDLDEYEKSLLWAREHNKLPVPVRPVAHVVGIALSVEDREAMRQNRERAQAIYDRIFARQE